MGIVGIEVDPEDVLPGALPARPNWIRQIPSEATINRWIEQAKELPRIVEH